MKKRKEPQKKSIKTRIITSILFCTLTTLFLGWYYGDVLHIAQQYSFFTTNPEQMKFVTDNSPYGYLWFVTALLLSILRRFPHSAHPNHYSAPDSIHI